MSLHFIIAFTRDVMKATQTNRNKEQQTRVVRDLLSLDVGRKQNPTPNGAPERSFILLILDLFENVNVHQF